MFIRLLQNADLRQLASFVSPALFDVLPARTILGRGRALLVGKQSATFRDTLAARAESLRALPLSVSLPGYPSARDSLGTDVHAHAERVVTLYFAQLFADTPSLLDLRSTSFTYHSGLLRWTPAPWVCRWSPDFLSAVRGLYDGFYMADDALFRESLRALRIELAEDLFRAHFGAHPERQRFQMKEFMKTFHEVFVRCRDARRELPEDFLPLGVYLATLYEHLDRLPVEVDVPACYARGKRREASETAGQGGAAEEFRHG